MLHDVPPLFLVPVGALLAVFRLLEGRPAAVRSCYVLFFLGFGLDFVAVFAVALFCLAEHYSASGYYVVYVCHIIKGEKVRR